MKPAAIVHTTAGLFRIYDQGTDWQIIGPDNFERWRSTWQDDRAASLKAAAAICPGAARELTIYTPSSEQNDPDF
jgi:hypothetical protein